MHPQVFLGFQGNDQLSSNYGQDWQSGAVIPVFRPSESFAHPMLGQSAGVFNASAALVPASGFSGQVDSGFFAAPNWTMVTQAAGPHQTHTAQLTAVPFY